MTKMDKTLVMNLSQDFDLLAFKYVFLYLSMMWSQKKHYLLESIHWGLRLSFQNMAKIKWNDY